MSFPSQLLYTVNSCNKLDRMTPETDRCPDEFYPKCYIFGNKEGYDLFVEDFRRCAATSFLKYAHDQLLMNFRLKCGKAFLGLTRTFRRFFIYSQYWTVHLLIRTILNFLQSETGNEKTHEWVDAEFLDFAIETTREHYRTNESTTASTIFRNTAGKKCCCLSQGLYLFATLFANLFFSKGACTVVGRFQQNNTYNSLTVSEEGHLAGNRSITV